MIITTHELYDFYYLITVIRNEITDKNNIYILKKVTDLYKNGVEEIDDNRLRKLMISLNICDDKWSVLCYENRYSQESGLLKDKEKMEFLIINMNELENLLIQKKYDQAFDLADALHMYPEIVANNLKKFPKSYWKLIYNPYKKSGLNNCSMTCQHIHLFQLQNDMKKKMNMADQSAIFVLIMNWD